jgi:hypothetical protein
MAKAKSIYSPHPSIAMTIKWVKGLPVKTGKSLEQWISFINKNGPKTVEARRNWLKKEYKLGTNTAWWLADHAEGKRQEDLDPKAYIAKAEEWVAAMKAKKPLLVPFYEEVLQRVFQLGSDVKVCPCQTMVPFYRNNVFGKVTFSTRTRLDLGLCLRGVPFTKRLTDTGGTAKKDRITHNLAIASLDDLDAEVNAWLLKAYEMDA